ncbi:hypothetical protein FA15DRAFT_707433 [Coprinopsis marcescibilis]|uniref:Uncharacterized protein n=1 Tax=Coprinopsis marcescibilis TaxID=230819 RepID=A0A5C3KLS5_COPMA|nr:hypothetical protein FA15DRAFT_707433 [Coprinopsis marcescibilis]
MTGSLANAASASGEAFFKSGEYLLAQKRFSEASKLEPNEPMHVINLTRAFYEQGKYPACLKSALVAWQKVKLKEAITLVKHGTDHGKTSASSTYNDSTSTSKNAADTSNSLYILIAMIYAKAQIYHGHLGKLLTFLHDRGRGGINPLREDIGSSEMEGTQRGTTRGAEESMTSQASTSNGDLLAGKLSTEIEAFINMTIASSKKGTTMSSMAGAIDGEIAESFTCSFDTSVLEFWKTKCIDCDYFQEGTAQGFETPGHEHTCPSKERIAQGAGRAHWYKRIDAGRYSIYYDMPLFKTCLNAGTSILKFENEAVQYIASGSSGGMDSKLLSYVVKSRSFTTKGQIPLLYAGISDGRSIFADGVALSGQILHRMMGLMRGTMVAVNAGHKIHVTAIDTQPIVISKFIVTYHLLYFTKKRYRECEDVCDSAVYATLMYLTLGLIMPKYCCDLIEKTVDLVLAQLSHENEEERQQPLGGEYPLFLRDLSVTEVKSVFEYWKRCITDGTVNDTKQLLSNNPIEQDDPVEHLRLVSADNLIGPGSSANGPNTGAEEVAADEAASAKKSKKKKKKRADGAAANRKPSAIIAMAVCPNEKLPEASEPAYNDINKEFQIYRTSRTFFPPQDLLEARHPALGKLIECKGTPNDVLVAAAQDEVDKEWVINPLLLDETDDQQYPRIPTTPLDTLYMMLLQLSKLKGTKYEYGKVMFPGKTAIAVTRSYFRAIADMIAGELQVELVAGDVYQVLRQLSDAGVGSTSGRPESFPRQYWRMWLTNIPDYQGGALNVVTSLLPSLKTDADAMIIFDSERRLPHEYDTFENKCYQQAFIFPAEFPRYLGCTYEHKGGFSLQGSDKRMHTLTVQSPGQPLKALASKRELYDWLTRILLAILCNGRPPPPTEDFEGVSTENIINAGTWHDWETPTTLSTFLRLIEHLSLVGFPASWLGEYLGPLLAESPSVTTRVKPYRGSLPRPLPGSKGCEDLIAQKCRTVSLEFWKADLHALASLVGDGLSVPIVVPGSLPVARDSSELGLVEFNVKFEPRKRRRVPGDVDGNAKGMGKADVGLPWSRSVYIIFYNPNVGGGDGSGAKWDGVTVSPSVLMEEILDGLCDELGEMPGDIGERVQVVTLQYGRDVLGKSPVGFKLRALWYEKARREGWMVVAYRCDYGVVVTKPVPAKDWKTMRFVTPGST